MNETAGMDSGYRFISIIDALQPTVLRFAPSSSATLLALKSWVECSSAIAADDYNLNREHYIRVPNASPYLGPASRRMYRFVREQLSVPFMQEGTIRTPEPESSDGKINGEHISFKGTINTPTVGSLMTTIYQSMRDGTLYLAVMECLHEIA